MKISKMNWLWPFFGLTKALKAKERSKSTKLTAEVDTGELAIK
jgi:hypothetical protein